MTDIKYEPTRDYWTPYAPWMRDALAADARTSRIDGGEESRMKWERRLTLGRPLDGVKVHPDDVPERPTEDDPDEALAVIIEKLVDDHGRTTEWADNEYITRSTALAIARAAREHIEAEPADITEEPPVGSQVTDCMGDVWQRREEGWTLWWPQRAGWLADLYGDLDQWSVVLNLGFRPTTDEDRKRVGLPVTAPADDGLAEWERELLRNADTPEEWHAGPAPADVDPLAEAIRVGVGKPSASDEEMWANAARAAREHIAQEPDPAPADVEDERIGAWHRVAGHPFFRGCYAQERPLIDAMLDLLTLAATSAETVHSHGPAQGQGRDCSERTDGHGHMRGMCMASAQADEDSDAVTISLPRDDLTKPAVLRLAAADLRRKYHLGMGGLPRSLPGTLDALADGLDALLNPPTEGTDHE